MNILITTFSFPSIQGNNHDGAFVLSEAMAYSENKARIRVVTPLYRGAAKRERINERIEVFRFQYFFPGSFQVLKKPGVPVYNQRSFLAIVQIPLLCLLFALNILRHSQWADIIHAQWTVTALLCLPAKWIRGKKIVLTARGSDLRLLPRWLNRLIHSRVDAAIDCFGPQPWNDEYKRNFPARYIKLPLIVRNDPSDMMPEDMRSSLAKSPGAFIILYVGRFDYIKLNQNNLPLINMIHVSKKLKEKGKNFHFFCIGDGEDRIKQTMTTLIHEFQLGDCVTMLGVKVNVLDYIAFSHLGLGGIAFNGVSQEFTICGKPQVLVKGTDNDGLPWRHGVNCVFVEPDDRVDLLEKLIWAMNHPEKLREIGETARAEMNLFIVDGKEGGIRYLREFQGLLGSFPPERDPPELDFNSTLSKR